MLHLRLNRAATLIPLQPTVKDHNRQRQENRCHQQQLSQRCPRKGAHKFRRHRADKGRWQDRKEQKARHAIKHRQRIERKGDQCIERLPRQHISLPQPESRAMDNHQHGDKKRHRNQNAKDKAGKGVPRIIARRQKTQNPISDIAQAGGVTTGRQHMEQHWPR